MGNIDLTTTQQNTPTDNEIRNFEVPVKPERTRRRMLIYLTAVIGLLLLIGGGIYYISEFILRPQVQEVDETETAPTPTTVTPTPTATPTPEEENELDSDSLIMEIEGSTESLGDGTDSMTESLDKLDIDSADSELQNTVF